MTVKQRAYQMVMGMVLSLAALAGIAVASSGPSSDKTRCGSVLANQRRLEKTEAIATARSSVAEPVALCVAGRWDDYTGVYSDVWSDGDYAYLPNYAGADGRPARVHVIDIRNPPGLVLDETLFLPPPNDDASPQDVKVGDGLLFVGLESDGDDSVAIYDIRNPANRQLIATVRIAGFEAIHNLFYEGGFLYLPEGNAIAIVDLSSFNPDSPPPSPITTAKWILTGVGNLFVHDVTVQNGRLYAAAWDSLRIYDVSNVATTMPTLLGSVAGSATHSMWATDDGQFVVTGEERPGGGIHVYRITDNGGSVTLTLTDALAYPSGEVFSVHNQAIIGNRLYNSWYGRGLEIYDINATTGLLEFVGRLDTANNWGVYPFLGDDRILLSDMSEGLYVVKVDCPCLASARPQPETLPSAPLTAPLAGGTGADAVGLAVNAKNRFASIKTSDAGRIQAIRVRFVDLPSPFNVWNGMDFFAGAPREVCENSGKGMRTEPQDCPNGLPTRTFWAAPLVCAKEEAHFTDWRGSCAEGTCGGGFNSGDSCVVDDDCVEVVHLYHEGLIPGGIYDIQVVDGNCPLQSESSYSAALTMTQARWGDVCGPGPGGACSTEADGTVDVANDVLGVLDKFENVNYLQKTRADLEPGDDFFNNASDFKVNVANDVLFCLGAFTGDPYPFVPGDPCRPD